MGALISLAPNVIFEWGTNIGKSARIFLEISRFIDLNVRIYSIDLPNGSSHNEHARELTGSLVKDCGSWCPNDLSLEELPNRCGGSEVLLFAGDGLDKTVELHHQLNEQLVQEFRPKRCLVFIDGDHHYESVKRDLDGIVVNLPQANILLHDTGYSDAPGVNIGPYRAIQEVLNERKPGFEVMTTQGFPGMTLLYREQQNV